MAQCFKAVSGSGTIASQSAEFHKESISKVAAPASVEVRNFAFTGPFQDLNCHT
jgi:hypothetical protein